MNVFKRFRERAKRAAAAIGRLFNRRKTTPAPSESANIQQKTRKKYKTPEDWGDSWVKQREEYLKSKDMEWRQAQQDQAYRTFSEQYGFSRDEWEEFFDELGGELGELSHYLEGGSPTVFDAYREFKKQLPTGTPSEFRDMFKITQSIKPGQDQKEFYDNLTDTMETYAYFVNELGGDTGDFKYFVDFVKEEYKDKEGTEFQEQLRFEIKREKDARKK